MLILGAYLPPGHEHQSQCRASFPASGLRANVISGSTGSTSPYRPAMPPMAGVPLLSQSIPYPSAYMAPPACPMYMPSYLPRPQMEQSSTQSERELLAMQRQELEARELEVDRRTSALNLNAVRDDETRSAVPSVRCSRTHTAQKTGAHYTKTCQFIIHNSKIPFPLKGPPLTALMDQGQQYGNH